jgi:hypothetical protein
MSQITTQRYREVAQSAPNHIAGKKRTQALTSGSVNLECVLSPYCYDYCLFDHLDVLRSWLKKRKNYQVGGIQADTCSNFSPCELFHLIESQDPHQYVVIMKSNLFQNVYPHNTYPESAETASYHLQIHHIWL